VDIDFNIMRENGFYKKVLEELKENLAKIDQTVGWKLVDTCPICGCKETIGGRFTKTGYTHQICANCYCLYSTKVPVESNKAEYEYSSTTEIENSRDERKREYKRQRFAKERIKLIKEFVGDLSKLSLLDYGCGTGIFLEEAMHHFNIADGVESSKTLIEYTVSKLGSGRFLSASNVYDSFNIYNDDGSFRSNIIFDTLYSVREIRDSYDVITMFDVLEHLEKPIDNLLQLRDLLTEGGILVVFTPNWRSLAFDLLDDKNTQFYPTEHLFFLSKPTVDYLSERLGMTLVHYETAGMDWFDIAAFLRDMENIDLDESIFVSKLNYLQDKTNRIGYANHMRFILQAW